MMFAVWSWGPFDRTIMIILPIEITRRGGARDMDVLPLVPLLEGEG